MTILLPGYKLCTMKLVIQLMDSLTARTNESCYLDPNPHPNMFGYDFFWVRVLLSTNSLVVKL